MYKSQNANCVNPVIPHELNFLIFLHLKLALHNINMNGSIHANNAKCWFFSSLRMILKSK